MSAAVVSSPWRNGRKRVFQSVFQTDVVHPTPVSTPAVDFPQPGQAFGLLSQSPNHGTPSSRIPQKSGSGGIPEPSQTQTLRQHRSDRGLSELRKPQSLTANPLAPDSAVSVSQSSAGDDQSAYDLAWHIVTSRISLPPSASADDSFGTLAPSSQLATQGESSEAEFYDAVRLLVHAETALPQAVHTEDVVAWHTQQTRTHFAQHVLPLLSACAQGEGDIDPRAGHPASDGHQERHMVAVRSSIRTIEGAQRMYGYGLELLKRAMLRASGPDAQARETDTSLLESKFERDVHALVANAASDSLWHSLRIVLDRLASSILGIRPGPGGPGDGHVRPVPPAEDNLQAVADRERLLQLVQELGGVGLGGEQFQVIFARVMDAMMSRFVDGAYAGIWTRSHAPDVFGKKANTARVATTGTASSHCIDALTEWVENHFARLVSEVLSQLNSSPTSPPVSLADVKTYQALALGRLASLRIRELFDIVLAWPNTRGALDDLRATITTPARRMQLTDSFTQALQKRLLHSGRSTLEILQTYISIVRTFYALDHSKVLLSRVVLNLDLYLCHRDDAVRTVVTGLLTSPDELYLVPKPSERHRGHKERERRTKETPANAVSAGAETVTPAVATASVPRKGLRRQMHRTPDVPARSRRARSGTPSSKPNTTPQATVAPTSDTLVELAILLLDPKQVRRGGPEEEELDWDDMSWVPDPVDAGASYKRPKSEDVIGTLISALGSQDVFIKEFSSVMAERLLGESVRLDQELRVLDLLKRRFGEPALQSCDVMIKDIQDSTQVDATIVRGDKREDRSEDGTRYHARILSRLFWPGLDREHFLLPPPIQERQARYEGGFEALKASRKLTWLNQLGQARVELELLDRTVTVDCKTYEATVIYAFQAAGDNDDAAAPPVERTPDELYMQLQMDEDLITSALDFWVAQGVLRRAGQDVFRVVERLPTAAELAAEAAAAADGDDEAAQDGAEAGQPVAVVAVDPRELERQAMYWQYIKSMLTNARASMPLAQMAMMLRMLITDFAWGNEELVDFLADKVAEGELELVGGKYKLVKK